MHILFFLLAIILFFLLFVFVFAISIVGRFLSLFKRNDRNTQDTQAQMRTTQSPHQKIISKDEGEYVDFEEIK